MAMLNSQALAVLTPTEMEKRIALAKFPQQLSATDKQMLVTVAIEYGLDPLMGELTVFQGRPYVSIDGRYRKAHETGQLEGVESRPASATEREIWEIPAGDFFFRAEIWKKGCAHPFVGWGRVRHAETEAPKSGAAGYRPLEVNPQRMAEKRAEAQALRKAFYLPLPSTEAPDDDDQPPQPGPQAAPEPPTPPKPPPQPSEAPPEASQEPVIPERARADTEDPVMQELEAKREILRDLLLWAKQRKPPMNPARLWALCLEHVKVDRLENITLAQWRELQQWFATLP